MQCLSYWPAHSKKTAFFPMLVIPVISSETQKKSVGLGKTGAKVFKDGRESSWDATLKKPVPRLIRMLVSDRFFVPKQRQAFIAPLSRTSYTKEFTCKVDCSPYLTGLCRTAFFQKSFQRKWGPQNQRYPII